ncbi:hypothetical protein NL676_003226 [Syzygium grande]|nr:hypothetical protein NL676_003226 [Syzygium grande]
MCESAACNYRTSTPVASDPTASHAPEIARKYGSRGYEREEAYGIDEEGEEEASERERERENRARPNRDPVVVVAKGGCSE